MTTVVRAPDIHFNLRSLPFWSRLLLEAGYRERAVETSNKDSYRFTTQTSTVNPPDQVAVASPLFRERATRIPYFDVSFPIGLHQFKFTYEYRPLPPAFALHPRLDPLERPALRNRAREQAGGAGEVDGPGRNRSAVGRSSHPAPARAPPERRRPDAHPPGQRHPAVPQVLHPRLDVPRIERRPA